MRRSGSPTAVWPGRPAPLGASWDGEGVNFALFSGDAEKVELCLFDDGARHEVQRIELRERTNRVWHCYLPEARPGLAYGYRVHGPYAPRRGLRFNRHKLLLDPYARAIAGTLRWHDALFGYRVCHGRQDLSFDRHDSAPYVPRARVVETAFSWGDDRPPAVPWTDTVIYELHVRGFTMRHPEIPAHLRGTWAALAHEAVIDYLRRLGVTAVELLPVHAFVDERHLVEQGLRNFWGYNTLAWFAPEPRYGVAGGVDEFKSMVRALHSAGIEVILDVVYNHTCEGNHLGPTLSLRGIDNAAYYRLEEADPRYYSDFTGCGNTLNVPHPRAMQLVLDSLRYWAGEMHVDGFRFDLAPALARSRGEAPGWTSFFDVVDQDPLLGRLKRIAEPWDLGVGGYHLGDFPGGWAEWNDRYREGTRAWWKGDPGTIGELASRLAGSSDVYGPAGRNPHASVNYVTSHDGFTLADLVRPERGAGDGPGSARGPSSSARPGDGVPDRAAHGHPARALPARRQRNLLATLLLSQGVPMLLAGDEIGRTQHGNDNAYCHDDELSWIDWNLDEARMDLLAFTRRLVHLRRAHPALRRSTFFRGASHDGAPADIVWLRPDGREMGEDDWRDDAARCLAAYLPAARLDGRDRRGRPLRDDDILMLFNARSEDTAFVLHEQSHASPWRCLLDTARDCEATAVGSAATDAATVPGQAEPQRPPRRSAGQARFIAHGHSLVLLTRTISTS